MPLSRNSKIKEVWKHPIGQDILQKLMRREGKKEDWASGWAAGNMSVSYLDKFGGANFSDSLVALLNSNRVQEAVQGAAPRQIWWKEAAFYRIYLPSFMDSDHDGIGDVMGIVQRLTYLQRLGVNVLWLSPFLGTALYDNDRSNTLDISSDFGKMADFGMLADLAHQNDMHIVLEADISSTSERHPWFVAALAGDQKYREYYYFVESKQDVQPANSERSGATVWRWFAEAGTWVLCFASSGRPDLNWNNKQLRGKMYDLLKGWLHLGADGFALTPIYSLGRESSTDKDPRLAGVKEIFGLETHTYGVQMHNHLKELRENLGENVLLMADFPGIAPEMAKLFTLECNNELDMVWNSVPIAVGGRKLGEEGRVYLQDIKNYFLGWENYAKTSCMPLFFGSPNLPRMVSRVGASAIYRSTVAKMLATMLFTLRGAPIVYQGDELGIPNTRFSGIEDMRSARSIALFSELCIQHGEEDAFKKLLPYMPDHARTPMMWGGGMYAGFTGAVPWIRMTDGIDHLNATVQLQDKSSVLNHYRSVIELRKKTPAMSYGAFTPVFIKNKSVFCYFRILDGKKWYIEINITGREISHPGRILKTQKLLVSNYENPSRALRPYEANIYKCE